MMLEQLDFIRWLLIELRFLKFPASKKINDDEILHFFTIYNVLIFCEFI